MVAALILTGGPGTGKSSALAALATLLEIEGVEFGALESEQLAWGWPWLSVSEAVEQLAAVLGFQRRAGRCLFLLAATTENVEELRAVVGAVRADLLLVVCLTAPAEIVTARLAVREADRRPAKLDLIARARTLAHTIPRIEGIDVVIDTEAGDPHEVAVQIRNAMRLYRLLSGATRPS